MYAVRLFCIRHASFFGKLYKSLERFFTSFDPVFSRLGYEHLEKPVALVERISKGFLFDCKMCGQCVLSSTGMSCPMNCPKNLRNGPCGGVRDGGFCEVEPGMRCVWVEGWNGAARMPGGLERIAIVQPPVNRELEGSSSWLRAIRERVALRHRQAEPADRDKSEMARAFADARKAQPTTAPLAVEPQSALSEQSVSEQTSVHKSGGNEK